MPEIAEVARVVHQIRKRLVGTTVKYVLAKDDANIFGKVGTTATEFQNAMMGKKITGAGQQGKYFWITMSSPPHPLLHFGMSGWLHIRGESKLRFKSQNSSTQDITDGNEKEKEDWPPKYWKFMLESTDTNDANRKVEAAFSDARRFGRIRLLSCAKGDIRKTSPLKKNGPDPVIDKHIITLDWLQKKLKNKHVPIKSFLLNQANISGIGNWVADEILYNARIHPEQYCDSLSTAQLESVHRHMMYVCETAVGVLADSEKFPSEWLFNYRWGKAKLRKKLTKSKDDECADNLVDCLPNGDKIAFVTVGGRTSCYVPRVQKITLDNMPATVDHDEHQKSMDPGTKSNAANKRKRTEAKTDKKQKDTISIEKKRVMRSMKNLKIEPAEETGENTSTSVKKFRAKSEY
ncbi:Formamidopyrimidine-DNA glycosylase [Golovinomyces cichoracearum]|uniref:Formamidopyrimidine-DNA glycosylase n=1 Tax=Golovinomyces cichoracearum TaxID=62708 RepID=A0A420IT30_9PEZI|nr:Formamidopyrimidine-DNA glycosylase [Golovinomyces cichoracearum]